MQLITLGIGGIIFTTMLYRSKLVPRFISIVGIIGYSLLIPAFLIAIYGVLDPTPGGPGTFLAVPVAFFEIILMPIWLFWKGFNKSVISANAGVVSGKMDVEPTNA